jgi:hypothetical protein
MIQSGFMITIYRRAEVIARCERAEVLAGLKSGRFELTDHYESPETDGWISLTHFESRAYERPAPTDRPSKPNFICSYGDTIEPDPNLRPIQDLKQLGELIRLSERRPPSQPAAPRPDTTADPFIEPLALLTAPFRLLSQLVEWTVDTLFDLIGKIAIPVIVAVLLIATVIASIYAPRLLWGTALALLWFCRRK